MSVNMRPCQLVGSYPGCSYDAVPALSNHARRRKAVGSARGTSLVGDLVSPATVS